MVHVDEEVDSTQTLEPCYCLQQPIGFEGDSDGGAKSGSHAHSSRESQPSQPIEWSALIFPLFWVSVSASIPATID